MLNAYDDVTTWDVIVLGAGAAGLFCAAIAASHGARVVVLEHNAKPGKKIRISGGGRCNFTNLHTTHQNFLSENPDFARSALSRYTPQDFIDLVDRYGIAWHEKTLGQLFCDGSAQQIIDMLMDECKSAGAEVHLATTVEHVERFQMFDVETNVGIYRSHRLVLATGGLSIPALGATGIGYGIARHFGHRVVTPEPALVPMVCDAEWDARFGSLSGVSMDVEAQSDGPPFRENLLFTHKGLSGPAILQASSYWHDGGVLEIDTIPDTDDEGLYTRLRVDKRILRNALSDVLPLRFLQQWSDPRLDHKAIDLKRAQVMDLLESLHHWTVEPTTTEGFAKAEVTRGGIDTSELSSKTMESRLTPGLYCIGEVVDVTGWLGGYNFQWAWSSAYAAGTACATG